MGLGDFLKGVGGGIVKGYEAVNKGAYNATQALASGVDRGINQINPMGDIHPFGNTVKDVNNTGKLLELAGSHPLDTASAIGTGLQFGFDHPGLVAKGAWAVAKEQAKPENLLETGITALATGGIGALGAEAAGSAEAIEGVSKASRLSRFTEASSSGTLDKVLGTGEASTIKKLSHPINTYITQPIKDKAAQAILDVGGEAGTLRQGAAMAVQGGGVKPAALSGLSEEAAATQQTMRRVQGAQSRYSQFQSGLAGGEVLANPKKAAMGFATSHKQEAIDYASGHSQEVGQALQEVGKRPAGMSQSKLADIGGDLHETSQLPVVTGNGGNQPPPFQPVQTGGTPPEEPSRPQSLSNNQFAMKPVLQQPSNSQPSSTGGGSGNFGANQGMGQVSQQGGSWMSQRSPRTQALLRTAASYKSQKRFYEGPNREVFRGVDAGYDWRSIEMRDNKFGFNLHPVQGQGQGRAGAEPDPSNMRQPIGQTGPKPELSGSLAQPATSESMKSVAEPYMSIGDQPSGALNPAVPRTIQPAKAPGSERKISAQQNRSEFFKSGSVFDRDSALPPLSQPMARPQRQRDVLGV